jgi:hypothetical protein
LAAGRHALKADFAASQRRSEESGPGNDRVSANIPKKHLFLIKPRQHVINPKRFGNHFLHGACSAFQACPAENLPRGNMI